MANTLAGKYDQNVATVNNLIKKVEGVIKNVNKYLQPAIMFKADNGSWNFVSTGSHFATSFVGVGATPLVATSYTAELWLLLTRSSCTLRRLVLRFW